MSHRTLFLLSFSTLFPEKGEGKKKKMFFRMPWSMAVVMATIAIHPTFGQSTYKLQPGQNWSVSYLFLPFFCFLRNDSKILPPHTCVLKFSFPILHTPTTSGQAGRKKWISMALHQRKTTFPSDQPRKSCNRTAYLRSLNSLRQSPSKYFIFLSPIFSPFRPFFRVGVITEQLAIVLSLHQRRCHGI